MLRVVTGQTRTGKRKTDTRTVTLRIKQVYLEQIAAGQKSMEFRAMNEHYIAKFLRPFDKLKLHFQTTRQVIVEVKNVSVQEKEGIPLFCLSLGRVISQVQ